MTTSSKKMKEDKRPSQWREILSAGVDGWSSFSDTCSDEPNEKDRGNNNITTSKSVLEVQQQQHQQTNHHFHQKEKSYPSLDVHWKQERRDIEWQCLWLELRLKELQSHKNRYEKKLKLLDENAAAGGDKERTSKPKSKNGKLAKMVVFNEHPLFDPIRRRREKILKKRKLMTSDEDDDKEKDGEDAKMATEVPDEDGKSNKKAKTDDDTSKEHKGNKSGSGGDSDVSNTVMHEKCEDLKKRCLGLMQRLGQPPPIFTSNQGSGGGAKGGKGGGGGGGSGRGNRNGRNRNRNYPHGGGSGGNAGGAGSGKDGNNDTNKAEAGNNNNNTRKHMSRKTDEYDINNVVGDIVGAKYVERALHEDINTPSVRVVTTFTMSVEELRRLNNMDAAATADAKNKDGDDSSDEDISDEAFATRHAKYEVMERNARMPLELLKKAEREKNGGKSPRGRKANKPSSVSKSNSGNEDEKRAVKRSVDLNAIHASAPVVLSKKGGDAPRASESNSDSPSDGSAELNEDVVREILRAS